MEHVAKRLIYAQFRRLEPYSVLRKVFESSRRCKIGTARKMPPMNIREGIIIPSWPGLGVRVKEPIANSTSTKIAKAGMRLRAKMWGADQITVLDRGRDRESIHCVGSCCACRKRALARTDNTIIVSLMAWDKERESVMQGKRV